MKTKTPQNQSQEGNSTRKVLNRENGEDRKTSDGASPSPDTQTPEDPAQYSGDFCLSDKIELLNLRVAGNPGTGKALSSTSVITTREIKEFVRRLKQGIINEDTEAKKHKGAISEQSQLCFRMILHAIDKLAGSKLT